MAEISKKISQLNRNTDHLFAKASRLRYLLHDTEKEIHRTLLKERELIHLLLSIIKESPKHKEQI